MGSKLTHTVSGAMASFKSADKANIESLKVYFNPVQEGTGDPSPSNVREISGYNSVNTYKMGKNLFNTLPSLATEPLHLNTYCVGYSFASSKNQWLYSTTTFEISSISQGSISLISKSNTTAYGLTYCIPAKPNTDYTFSFTTTNGRIVFQEWTSSEYITGYAQNTSPITFTSDSNVYCFVISFIPAVGNTTVTFSNIQLEYGSTATSYEPYNGQTIPITFPVLGKNLFGLDLELGAINYNTGEANIETDSRIRTIGEISVIPNETYTISASGMYSVTVLGYDKDMNYIGANKDKILPYTFTFKKPNVQYIRFNFKANSSGTTTSLSAISNVQLEYGDTVTTYEPYNSDNTVYGGYIDIAKGELVQEWNSIIIDGVTTNRKVNSDYSNDTYIIGGVVYLTPNGVSDKQTVPTYVLCDNMPVLAPSNNLETIPSVRTISAGSQYLRFYLGLTSEHTDLDTAQKRKDFCNEYFQEHPTQIVYKLSTPITYKLTPIQLQTFLNQNNIWSNTNRDIECTYEVIDHLNKKRITLNEPHIETVTGSVASFNTDMQAPIKSAKVYFSPVQEGSGDPSPSNVREITGKTILYHGHQGKNLFDYTTAIKNDNLYRNDNGEITSTQSNFYISSTISVKPQYRYTFYWPGARIRIYFLTNDGTWISRTASFDISTGGTLYANMPDNCYKIQIQATLDSDMSKLIMTEQVKDLLTTDWSSTAGTLYGGYVDLISGKLVQEWDSLTFNGTTVSVQGAYSNAVIDRFGGVYTKLPTNIDLNNIICNKRKIQATNDMNDLLDLNTLYVYNSQYLVFVADTISEHSDLSTSQKKAFTNNLLKEDPVTIVYKLTVPQIYQLTPIQLKSLIGTNNIWSNANGNIEVKYWTH